MVGLTFYPIIRYNLFGVKVHPSGPAAACLRRHLKKSYFLDGYGTVSYVLKRTYLKTI